MMSVDNPYRFNHERLYVIKGRPPKGEHSVAAQKLLRCLTMLKMLHEARYTIASMATKFECSERTIYRYIALFEEAGFIIDSDFNHKFFVV